MNISPSVKEKFPGAAAAVVIFLFLFINLANLNKYGDGLDGTRALLRGSYSLQLAKQVLAGGKALSEDDLSALVALYHPPLFAMLNYKAYEVGSKWGMNCIDARHYFCVIWSTIGLLFLFLLVKSSWGPWEGLASVIFLALYPHFIAHSHYNPKDVPLLVSTIISVYFFVEFLDTKSFFSAIKAGLAWGIAMGTGLNALLLFPVYLFALIFKKINSRSSGLLGPTLVFCGVGLITLYVSWPLLWIQPSHMLDSIHFFSGDFLPFDVLYFGNFYPNTELPWHFTPMYVFLVTPLLMVGCAAVGVYAAHGRKESFSSRKLLPILPGWFLIPILIRMMPGVARYDGIRHVFISIGPLAIYAGVGFVFSARYLVKKFSFSFWAWPALTLVLILYMGSEVARAHPFEGSYLNEAVRIGLPSHLENYFNLAIWGTQTREGAEWLNQNAPTGSRVCIEGEYFLPCLLRSDLKPDCHRPVDYYVFLSRKKTAVPTEPLPVFKISRMNSDLLYIYRGRKVEKKSDLTEENGGHLPAKTVRKRKS